MEVENVNLKTSNIQLNEANAEAKHILYGQEEKLIATESKLNMELATQMTLGPELAAKESKMTILKTELELMKSSVEEVVSNLMKDLENEKKMAAENMACVESRNQAAYSF